MKIAEIVVAVDFSECSRAAGARAAMVAERYGAHLHLLHAVPPVPYPAPAEFGLPPTVTQDMEEQATAKLQEWAEELQATGREVSHQVTLRPAVDAICDAARERGAELIVMGTHGYTGLKHLVLGSVAERTLRLAPCPVLAVKEALAQASHTLGRILLCTDFSPSADQATEFAIDLAGDFGAELHLAHALHPMIPAYPDLPPPEDYLAQARVAAGRQLESVQRRITDAGLEGTSNLLTGDPATAIAELGELHGLDLIVLGTRGNTGLKHVVLGSVAERTARLVRCSVLITKAADETD